MATATTIDAAEATELALAASTALGEASEAIERIAWAVNVPGGPDHDFPSIDEVKITDPEAGMRFLVAVNYARQDMEEMEGNLKRIEESIQESFFVVLNA